LLELWRQNLLQRKILRLMHPLRGHCEKEYGSCSALASNFHAADSGEAAG
jgi:hypothetical protein